jgi:hypothetical protein
MIFCYYGCGQNALYQFKNSKWCCSKNVQSCPEMKRKNEKSHTGENNPNFGKTYEEIYGLEKGKKQREIRSNAHLGKKSPNLNNYYSKDILKKLSESHRGKKNPIRSEMNKLQIGNKNPMFGRRGELSPVWKGGISFEPYDFKFNKELKNHIRKKFNHTCQLCKKWANIPHHIDYNKKNNQEDNFVLLCRSCNTKVNKNRVQWEIYFRLYLIFYNIGG